MHETILFEYPMNEKMRCWLRMEYLLNQFNSLQDTVQAADHDNARMMIFFRSITDLMDIFDRGDVRSELLRESELQIRKLRSWLERDGVDQTRVIDLSDQLQQQMRELNQAKRPGHVFKENPFIGQIRQRLNIPGGCCNFDLPALHLWLQSTAIRATDVEKWTESLRPLTQHLNFLLNLIRQSGQFVTLSCNKGFYQGTSEEADLLRIKLPLSAGLYPQISGLKNRYTLRFLPLNTDDILSEAPLFFDIACC